MRWSLSEFLNLLEIRSQCWCFVEVGEDAGFSVRHNDAIVFYAVLEGAAQITGTAEGDIEAQAGDILMITSGVPHALRTKSESRVEVLSFLDGGEYVDIPPTFRIGNGHARTRILCSKLKVRWPGGQKPEELPAVLRTRPPESIVDPENMERFASKHGAASVLTRAASLLFVTAFRSCPKCEALFQSSSRHDPISRAKQFIELHPFRDWTVERLARKVGMGRSNFAARFVSGLGKTPIEYLTEQRMKHAARLVEQTDLKILTISERIGYKSEAAFSRRFASFYGISPGRMRKLVCQKGVERGGVPL